VNRPSLAHFTNKICQFHHWNNASSRYGTAAAKLKRPHFNGLKEAAREMRQQAGQCMARLPAGTILMNSRLSFHPYSVR
jgi:predicted aldo/keto reductase-like oxidoreductase